MSVIAELVIAPSQDIAALMETSNPINHWESLNCTGVEPVMLSVLYSLAKDEIYDEIAHYAFQEHITPPDGPFLMQFDREMVQDFANFPAQNIPHLAQRWLKTDELQLADWKISDALGFIQNLVGFAQKAQAAGVELFLWMAL